MSIELVMPSSHLVLCHPFPSCPQSLSASVSFPMSRLFASDGEIFGDLASASILPMNIQSWRPLGLTGLIFLLSKGLTGVFSRTTVWRHQFFCAQPFFIVQLSHLYVTTGKKVTLTIWTFVAASTAKSLQSCPTLGDPIDRSPPGSPVPGILQARTLEWVAISFSNAWKWKVKMKSLSHVQLFTTPWTAAHQAPLSMGFSRQEYWIGVPLDLCWQSKVSNFNMLCRFVINFLPRSKCLLISWLQSPFAVIWSPRK